jgi:hypothetical protein
MFPTGRGKITFKQGARGSECVSKFCSFLQITTLEIFNKNPTSINSDHVTLMRKVN